jgi:predicted PurR-regulated permease PerM
MEAPSLFRPLLPPIVTGILAVAGLTVVLAGMHLAREVLAPIAFGVTLALATSPLIAWMRAKGVPRIAALLLAALLALLITAGIGAVVATTAQDLVEQAPEYQTRIEAVRVDAAGWLAAHGMDTQARALSGTPVGPELLVSSIAGALPSISNGLMSIFLTVLIVCFALAESDSLLDKMRAVLLHSTSTVGGNGPSRPEDQVSVPPRSAQTFVPLDTATHEIVAYIRVKTMTSVLKGALVVAVCLVLGIDFALLWGVLAFLLGYVPMIGGIIAVVPVSIVALLDRGFGIALAAAGAVVFIELVVSNIVEPRLAGRALDMSPLVMLVSMVIWGFVLGPVGALICGPLTTTVRIGVAYVPQLRVLAVLLGHRPEFATEPTRPLPLRLTGRLRIGQARGGITPANSPALRRD